MIEICDFNNRALLKLQIRMFMSLWEQLLNSIFLLYTLPLCWVPRSGPDLYVQGKKSCCINEHFLCQINVENHPEVAAGDTGGITKTDDSHTNVSSLFIFIIFPSPSVCRTSALHGQGKSESSQRSKSGCGAQVVPTLWTSIPRPWENTCPNTEWLCYDVSCRGTPCWRRLIQTIWVPQQYRKL